MHPKFAHFFWQAVVCPVQNKEVLAESIGALFLLHSLTGAKHGKTRTHFRVAGKKGRILGTCIVRESNPGRPRGRRAFYHWTNDARTAPKATTTHLIRQHSRTPGRRKKKKKRSPPRRGIEPRSPAWQAGILTTILTRIGWWEEPVLPR